MLPKYRKPTHPGEVLLEEFLKPLGITQLRLARHLGWTHAKVNDLIHQRRGITPSTALSLSDVLGPSPAFWMNLQTNYDLWMARQSHKAVPSLRKTG